MYGEEAFTSSLPGAPSVKKTLQNLTTSISTLSFNHDSQLAAMASNVKKDQMRLVSAWSPSYAHQVTYRVSTGPSPVINSVLKLANVEHTLRARHFRRLLTKRGVYRGRKQQRPCLAVSISTLCIFTIVTCPHYSTAFTLSFIGVLVLCALLELPS